MTWTRVTGNGFGDKSIAQFEAFKTFGSAMYVAGSNIVASGFKGDEEPGYAGAKIFRLVTGSPGDLDGDGIPDSEDNCPYIPNGTSLGTCTSGYDGVACMNNGDCGAAGFCSINQEDADSDGVGDVCDNCSIVYNPDQKDSFPPQGNGIGDACDCEGNFDCDNDVDSTDITAFLEDSGRNQYYNPCTSGSPCNGDFECDGDVDSADVTKFLEDSGRNAYNKPCTACTPGTPWCNY
jgi:hypothetical protein